ncbi:MAG TPA: hypothetical protein VIL85_10535 [Thermomicrobiales bacterium]|jgi:hypothetical protein
MRRRRISVLVAAFGLALVACGVAATPTPIDHPLAQIGCFRPLDAGPLTTVPAIDQRRAESVARDYYETKLGATLARDTDANGAQQPRAPLEARTLRINHSPYGQDVDPLRGRAVWLFGFAVERVTAWSTLKPGTTVYLLVDAQTAVPLLDCSSTPA